VPSYAGIVSYLGSQAYLQIKGILMAQDDIYLASFHFENPSGASSFRLYYQEDAVRSGVGTDTQVLANTLDDRLTTEITDMIADDFLFTAIVVHKISGDKEAKWRTDIVAQAGQRVGPSLPSNNCVLIGLSQGLFAAKHNGRIFIPGLAEGDSVVGNLLTAYQTGPLQAFVDAIADQLAEESAGTGRWNLGVINTLILNASPPIKDWQSAFSQVITVNGSPIIAGQKRRQTKVRGAA
jgi:hypothetical protein